MLDHVSVGVSDLERSARFYERTLAPLGLSRLVTRPATIGFGKAYPEFWINLRAGLARTEQGSGTHICLRADRPKRSTRSMGRRSNPAALPAARPVCARMIACATTRRSLSIPTAIGSRR